MATGTIENWTGTMAEIGAMYPFPGMETVLFVAGLVFWLGWHIVQLKREGAKLEEEVHRFGDPESMRKLLDRSDPHDV